MAYKTFERYCRDKGIDLTPDRPKCGEQLSDMYTGQWFIDRKLPMVVSCTGCDMTMCAFSASILIDEDGYVWCRGCADPDEEILT